MYRRWKVNKLNTSLVVVDYGTLWGATEGTASRRMEICGRQGPGLSMEARG